MGRNWKVSIKEDEVILYIVIEKATQCP